MKRFARPTLFDMAALLVAAVLFVLVSMPAAAQDDTADTEEVPVVSVTEAVQPPIALTEPTPPNTTPAASPAETPPQVYLVIVLGFIGLMAFFGLFGWVVNLVSKLMPPEDALKVARSIGQTGLQFTLDQTANTPFEIDDDVIIGLARQRGYEVVKREDGRNVVTIPAVKEDGKAEVEVTINNNPPVAPQDNG